MKHLKVANEGGVHVVQLGRPKANAMNFEMVEELIAALEAAREDSAARSVVFTSALPRFFSSGFDLDEVFAYNREPMRHFFGRFIDFYESVLRFPKPVVAALGGHTFAGGAFLALACDMRIMADGDFGFALNEINFAAIMPPAIRRALTATDPRFSRRMILTGDAVKPLDALASGLVDEVVPAGEVLPRALHWARYLGSKPAAAFAYDKRALLADAGHPEQSNERQIVEPFLDHWFSPESIALRRALVAGVKK